KVTCGACPSVVLPQMAASRPGLRELTIGHGVQLVVTHRSRLQRKPTEPKAARERGLHDRAGGAGETMPYVAAGEGNVEASGQLRCGRRRNRDPTGTTQPDSTD